MGTPWTLSCAQPRPQPELLQQRQQSRQFQQRQPVQNVHADRSSRIFSLAASLPCKCPKPRIASANAQHSCSVAAAQFSDRYEIGTNMSQYAQDEISAKTSKRCAYSDNIVTNRGTVGGFPISPSSNTYMNYNTHGSIQTRKPPGVQVKNLKLPESQLVQEKGSSRQTATGCHCGGQQAQANKTLLNDFEEVEQLIQEENDDVQIALRLQNRNIGSSQNAEGVCQIEQGGFQSQKGKLSCQNDEFEESDDEVSPEVAAAMMHSEEQGILMGAAPSRVFNALFSDDEKDIIAVTSAAPFQPQCVVVPASVDNMPYTSSAEDLVALTSSIQGNEPPPCSSIFSDELKQRGQYSSVLEEACKPNITEVIGSSENTSRTSLPCVGTIEYVLDAASPPDHYSRIQLRGSTSPEWFPGFFQALPNIDGITAVCRDPGSVLEDAWWTLQSTMA